MAKRKNLQRAYKDFTNEELIRLSNRVSWGPYMFPVSTREIMELIEEILRLRTVTS